MKANLIFLSAVFLCQFVFAQEACNDIPTVADFDGNVYNTVQIGNQCWMKENLKTMHYEDGSALVDGTGIGSIPWGNTTKYYFDYNDDTLNTLVYGKLYTWAAVMNGESSSDLVPSGVQGICPNGWHVPSKQEWEILANYLGGQNVAGGKKKEQDTIHWNSPNAATNISGFSALPAGIRDGSSFENLGIQTFFWTSKAGSDFANHRGLENFHISDIWGFTAKYFGYSVRCLRDTNSLSALIINLEKTNISCFGLNDGSIDLNVTWGTPPYSFIWSNGEITEDIDNLIAGTYFVTVSMSNNYSIIDSITLVEPTEIILSFDITDATNITSTDGEINLTVSGGFTPYTFNWSNGETIEDITGLNSGIYSVIVTDSLNCTINSSVNIAYLNNISELLQNKSISLMQNVPNPFSQTTEISFYIPEKAFVEIELFSLIGEKIETIHSQNYIAGNHTIIFDRKHLSAGTYFYRLNTGDFSETRIMSVE
ncbi:MAG: T9SS type A sorting domain-containing protein [Bacteroidetes bacterium]|jgi:uncharacterized protein (TIGR02145 family)|nr:T9SS type A sorting domain-containing protein [Bacteroidota bacterium]MBT7144726.1 T9SS type A sorting domain-containing protein [Bacteroidota bacterium]MBT7491205.1 T9SS type A sorting domain-containing protein [Bacteroidota bacterium]